MAAVLELAVVTAKSRRILELPRESRQAKAQPSQEGGSTIAGSRGPAGAEAKGLTLINLVRLGRRASVASENCLTHGINEPVALLRPLFAAAPVERGKE